MAVMTSKSVSRDMVTNSLTLFGGQVVIKMISFVLNVVVIRHLGIEEFGKYATCAAFGGLFVVLSDLGLAQVVIREIARDRRPEIIARLASNIIGLRIVLAAAVVGMTAIIARFAGYDGSIRFGILIGTLGLVSYAFFGIADTIMIGLERFRASAALNVCLQCVTLALSALLVFGGAGFLGLLLAPTIAVLGVGLAALRQLNETTPLRAPLEPRSWPGLLKRALPFAGIMLALSVSYKADTVILSFFVPTSDVGAYTVAYNLVFTCITFSHSINLALYPSLTREHACDSARAEALFRRGLRYLFLVSLPLAIFLSMNATAIVLMLYGERFARAAPALAIIAWVIPLMFIGEFLGYIAIIVDRERLAARANWVGATSNIVANLAFVPLFGILAAAAVTVATELVLVGQYVVALRQYELLTADRAILGRIIVAGAVSALVTFVLHRLAVPLFIVGVLGVASYLSTACALGAIGRAEWRLVTTSLDSRPRRLGGQSRAD